MTHLTEPLAAREGARDLLGRFGPQPNTTPEVSLAESSPLGTFTIPVDEINTGDTALIDGTPHTVNESWVSQGQPRLRIVSTDDGTFELDRETPVDIARTGDEPKPEDADDFAGHCHQCGAAFSQDQNFLTSHIHPRGGRDYNADENHTPYSLDDEL